MNDKISKKRKAKITLLNAFVYLSTGIIILMLIGIIGYVFYRGLPNLSFDFLTSTRRGRTVCFKEIAKQ